MENTAFSLPTEGFCRLRDILRVLPICKTRFYELVKSGEFPKPQKLGRASLWPVSAVREYLKKIGG